MCHAVKRTDECILCSGRRQSQFSQYSFISSLTHRLAVAKSLQSLELTCTVDHAGQCTQVLGDRPITVLLG